MPLKLSLLMNVLYVATAGYWVYRRGGIKNVNLRAIKGNEPPNHIVVRRELYHAFTRTPHTDKPIVMFGDSLTAAGLWGEWYGSSVVNRVIGQETTAEALLRVPDIAAMRPTKVFILYGNNDFGVVSPAESAANLRNFIFGLRSLSPATEIYLQSLLPPPSFTREAWVSQVNELFKQTADEHHLHWIDLCPNFRNGRVIDPKFTV